MTVGASAFEVAAGCRVCGKSTDEVQLSNFQKQCMKKGKIVTSKAYVSCTDSSVLAAPSVVAPARPTPDGAKDVTSSKVSMVSGKLMQAWLARCNAL